MQYCNRQGNLSVARLQSKQNPIDRKREIWLFDRGLFRGFMCDPRLCVFVAIVWLPVPELVLVRDADRFCPTARRPSRTLGSFSAPPSVCADEIQILLFLFFPKELVCCVFYVFPSLCARTLNKVNLYVSQKVNNGVLIYILYQCIS